jgi:hypothetical protein
MPDSDDEGTLLGKSAARLSVIAEGDETRRSSSDVRPTIATTSIRTAVDSPTQIVDSDEEAVPKRPPVAEASRRIRCAGRCPRRRRPST